MNTMTALPLWMEVDERPEDKQYIFNYHTMMCQQFANGFCPRHKNPRSATPRCFCVHFEPQRRRPLVDNQTGQLRYWDFLCEHVAEGGEGSCPCGDMCPFAHNREEIAFHAAQYKTKFCNSRDCPGEEVCCFAHEEGELRPHALERYSYWSVAAGANVVACFQGGPPRELPLAAGGLGGPSSPLMDLQAVDAGLSPNAPVGGRHGYPGQMGQMPTSPGQMGQMGQKALSGNAARWAVYKHRFCASFPHVSGCRRGDACAFAHSREEIRTPLLTDDEEAQVQAALTNEFFMYKFKTLWCPVGVQHDWQTCVYAHNYQDARRHPGIGYGPRPCPYWKRKETTLQYAQRCPLGVRCPFSHGAKEQLYHPAYFKTVTCQDWPNSNCPRGKLCAFWHRRSQQRNRASPDEEFNYKRPVPEDQMQANLQFDFLNPPFKLMNSPQEHPQGQPMSGALGPDYDCCPMMELPGPGAGALFGGRPNRGDCQALDAWHQQQQQQHFAIMSSEDAAAAICNNSPTGRGGAQVGAPYASARGGTGAGTGGVSPMTPTTALPSDSDEAASAAGGSTAGSDKGGHDDSLSFGSIPRWPGLSAQARDAGVMAPEGGFHVGGGYGLGGCGAMPPPPLMYCMQVPGSAPHSPAHGQVMMGSAAPWAGGGMPWGGSQHVPTGPGGWSPTAAAGNASVGYFGCGGMPCSLAYPPPPPMPVGVDVRRLGEDSGRAEERCFQGPMDGFNADVCFGDFAMAPVLALQDTGIDAAANADVYANCGYLPTTPTADMPTCNGFIHFKEGEDYYAGSDDEGLASPKPMRRRRSSSAH